jgi:hypothetical protein
MKNALNGMNPKYAEIDDQSSDHERWEGLQRAGYRKISHRELANRIPGMRAFPKKLHRTSCRHFPRRK